MYGSRGADVEDAAGGGGVGGGGAGAANDEAVAYEDAMRVWQRGFVERSSSRVGACGILGTPWRP